MKQRGKTILCIIAGNILLAFGVYAFILPNGFMLGGSTGIILTIQHFVPVRLSILSAIINSVLFLLGWRCLGREFAASSLLSTVIYPIIMAIFELFPIGEWFTGDSTMCALFGGVVIGAGIGLVIRAGGSTGGMDIPPCILNKYFGIPVGTSLCWFDTAIVLMQICFKGFDGILYSLFIIGLTSITVNRTIVSGENKLEIMIISPQYEAIRTELLETADCGLTLLNIETGYSRLDQKAVYSIVYAKKYPEIKSRVLAIDPDAFFVTTNVTDVNGRGYTLSRYA